MKPIDLRKSIKPKKESSGDAGHGRRGRGAVRVGKNVGTFAVEAQNFVPLRNDKSTSSAKLSRPLRRTPRIDRVETGIEASPRLPAPWRGLRLTKKKTIGLGLLIAVIVLIASYFIFYRQTQQSQAAEWFNEGWHYRQQFDVYNNSTTEDLLDFQVAIPTSTLNLSTLLTNNKLKSDYADLRFTDKNGNLLDYWFADATSSMDSVYVKFSTLTKSATTTVFMYYGNPSASDTRNGSNVFPDFFDDFKGNILDASKWTNGISGACTTSVSSGELQLYCPQTINISNYVQSINSFGLGKRADIRWKISYAFNFLADVGFSDGTNYSWAYRNDYRDRLYFNNYNGTGPASIAHVPMSPADYTSVYHSYGFSRVSSGISRYYLDNVQDGTDVTSSIPTGNLNLFIKDWTWNGGSPVGVGTLSVDYVAVRKVALIDPTVNATAGMAEEVGGGPVGYWKFDEGSGTTAYDSSGSGNDGTLTSMSTTGTSTAWVDGKINKALMFDGSDDNVAIGNKTVLDLTATGTISGWFKLTRNIAASQWGVVVNKNNWGSDRNGYSCYFQGNTNDFRCATSDASSAAFSSVSGISSFVGQWTHFVFTWGNGVQSLYINGKLKDQDAAKVNTPSAYNFAIGRSGGVSFPGIIDEIKVYNYNLSAAQVLAQYNSGKSVMFGADLGSKTQGLVGYWKMDEATSTWPGGASSTVFDFSGRGNNCTSTGDAQATTSAKFGNAGYFDGSGDYLTCGTSNLGVTDKVTVSAWFKVLGTPGTGYHIIFVRGSVDIELDVSQAGALRTGIYNAAGTRVAFNSGGGLADGNWHFLTMTYDGNLVKGYADGVFTGSSPQTGLIRAGGTAYIGMYSSSYYANGLIDDVKIYNVARTADQIMQDYLEGPGPVAYYNFEEGLGTSLYDRSGQGNTGTITPGSGGWQQGKIGTAYNFDGATTKISSNVYSQLTGAFTISAWVKPNIKTRQALVGFGNSQNYIALEHGGTGRPIIYFNNNNYRYFNPSAYNTLTDGKWHHVVFIITGSGLTDISNSAMYIDGLSQGVYATTQSDTPQPKTGFFIGSEDSSPSYSFKGTIDDLKVYNYVLTPWQIAQEYNNGKPIAQWSFDEGQGTTVNNTYSTSTGALTNMSVTGTSTAWTTGKMGKALMFDGVNDYITVNSNSAWDFAGKDVSISLWFKASLTQSGTTNMMLQHFTGGAPGNGWQMGLSSNKFYFENRANTDTISMQTVESYNDNKWHYATVVISNTFSNAYLYIDNVLKKTDTFSSLTDYSGSSLSFGANTGANYRFTGLLDEIKIYSYALSLAQIRQDYNDGLAASLSSSDGGQNIQNGLVGYWPMDESTSTWAGAGVTVFDFSGNGNNGTSVADAKASTTAKYGNAGYFDGTGDSVLLSSSILLTNADWTVSAWVKTSSAGEQGVLANSSGGPAVNAFEINNSKIYYYYYNNSWLGVSGSSNVADNNWHFLTWANHKDRTVDLYVDGVMEVKAASAPISGNNNGLVNQIGMAWDGSRPFNGSIDDVKVYNLARTPDQVMADYLTGPSPIVYYNFEEGAGTTVSDKSGNGNNPASITGLTATDWMPGKYGYAADFDGVSDYLTLTPAGLFNPIIGAVSLWIKPRTLCSAGQRYYFYHYYSGGNRIYLRSETACDGSGIMGIGNNTIGLAAGTFQVGVWQQFTMTYNSNTAYLYKNGKFVTSVAYSAPLDLGSTFYLSFTSSNSVDGLVDEIKIWNYTLTPAQVAQDYNGGKPIGYWKMDEGQGGTVYDYSGNGYNGTLSLNGSPATSSAWQSSSNCKLNGCLSFDGSNDLVNTGSDMIGTGDDSVSAWIYANSISNYRRIIDNGKTWLGIEANYCGIVNSIEWRSDGSTCTGAAANAITTGRWYHIAATRTSAGIHNIYINGVLSGAANQNGGTPVVGANAVIIGNRLAGDIGFDGKIDEVKVFNYVLSPAQIKNDYNMGKGIFFK